MMKIIDEKVDGIISAIHLIEHYPIPTQFRVTINQKWHERTQSVFKAQ